ncbi:MAG: dTDP-4-dehydrorhamnose 3,5-epimerase [Pseudomonadota bacterium]
MDVEALAIPDVKLIRPKIFEDARGSFSETYVRRRLDAVAPGVAFVQDNESVSERAFTVRGLHYQAPPHAQAKLVRVLRGAAFDVAVDIRRASPTYGRWAAATLTAEDRRQILIPEGFLHGFMTLEPGTVLSYKVTSYYDPPSDGAVHWRSLDIDWPAGAEAATLSEKDRAAPPFETFVSPF